MKSALLSMPTTPPAGLHQPREAKAFEAETAAYVEHLRTSPQASMFAGKRFEFLELRQRVEGLERCDIRCDAGCAVEVGEGVQMHVVSARLVVRSHGLALRLSHAPYDPSAENMRTRSARRSGLPHPPQSPIYSPREVGGRRVPRQPGQVRKEAALTSLTRVACPASHLARAASWSFVEAPRCTVP
jgi:hypothetical protein